MLERGGQILRILCFALAAYLVYELVHISSRGTLLSRVKIPELPTLASDTNAPAVVSVTNAPKPAANGTNVPSGQKGTNALASKSTTAAGTNLTSAAGRSAAATNVTSNSGSATNEPSRAVSTQPGSAKNVASEKEEPEDTETSTNTESKTKNVQSASSAATQAVASVASSTNGSNVLLIASATNVQASTTVSNASAISTNSLSNALAKVHGATATKKGRSGSPGDMAMAGGMHFPGMPGKGHAPTLPPEIKARVDKIYESEVLGQIIHMPMALQGIAGDYAIIQTPTGQSGLVKEGDSLGDVKLLRIGINRVLVEEGGHTQELTIFNGYGGQSLLTNENKTAK